MQRELPTPAGVSWSRAVILLGVVIDRVSHSFEYSSSLLVNPAMSVNVGGSRHFCVHFTNTSKRSTLSGPQSTPKSSSKEPSSII